MPASTAPTGSGRRAACSVPAECSRCGPTIRPTRRSSPCSPRCSPRWSRTWSRFPTTTPEASRPAPSTWPWGDLTGCRAGSVAGAELAAQAVPLGAGIVQPDDLHLLALLVVLERDGVEGGDRGRVVDLRLAEVDHHVVRIVGVVELVDEIVAR